MSQSKKNRSLFFKFRFVLPAIFALALSGNLHANQIQQVDKDSVYTYADKMPEFPGGEKGLVSFLSQHINFPAEAEKKNEHGKVFVQFIVNKTGKVENPKVIKGVSTELDNEALRVIGLLPDWTPGEQGGQKVAVQRIIPILFQALKDTVAEWQVTDKTLIVIDNVKMPAGLNVSLLNLSNMANATVLKPFPEEGKLKLIKKYGKQAADGVVLLTSKKDGVQYVLADSINANCKDDAVLAGFPGGEEKLLAYVADSIQYPFVAKRTNTQGKVLVQFLVDTTGKISNTKVIRSVDYFLDKEALRVVGTMPDWIPSTKCDKKVNTYVILPVAFKLEVPAKEKAWEQDAKTIILFNGERLPSTFKADWLNFANLSSYKVLQPSTKEITKKLVSQYGRDAAHGVILITTTK